MSSKPSVTKSVSNTQASLDAWAKRDEEKARQLADELRRALTAVTRACSAMVRHSKRGRNQYGMMREKIGRQEQVLRQRAIDKDLRTITRNFNKERAKRGLI